MVCPSCHSQIAEGMKFCPECGAPVALGCPNCGAQHAPGQKFCAECGTALNAGGAIPEPAAPPPVPHQVAPVAAEMRFVSVLFVDLVGFTALSEAREAEDVRELLGSYFDSARQTVERHGGVIEKFIGDAVMAVWGAPIAREDDAERAVRAALEVVDAVQAFGEEVGAAGLRARAGVVTGQVAALENPGEGLVVGDRVNTASRVQSAAEPGTVLVDDVTRQVTAEAIAFEDAGEHTVKGKADPLRLWRAVRVVGGVRGADREQGMEAAFVGRDGDLRLLKELFHGVPERRSARLVAVSAEAGMGKSRLRREFFNYIDGLSGTVLWHLGRCLSHGDGVAYWALAEMVRQRFGIAEDSTAQDATAKLAIGLERWVPSAQDREFVSPRLGALLGVSEPGLAREELFAGWRLFFELLAAHEPVALVFEDLQWADAGLLDFIEQLLDWSASSPIFILTLARPELVAGRDGWPAGRRGATMLQLEPLDDSAMRELLSELVAGLPAAAADRIVERAQGVPLYAIETVRALADRRVLAEREGRLVLEGELGELDVPASLSSLLSARLDALEAAERLLVKAMSVFGGSFPRSAAAALGEQGEEQLDAVLSSLVRKQVLTIRADRLSPDRGQYAFTQELLRTVAYEMLSRRERKARHLAAAQYLRQAFPDDGEDVAEVIAAHYLDAYRAAGEDPDAEALRADALAALRRAGQRAATVGAPEAAERAYRNAAELAGEQTEWAELTRAAGEMALQSGRLDSALELLEAVSDAYLAQDRTREAARVAAAISLVYGRLGRQKEAIERAETALSSFHGELDPDVAELNASLGRSFVFAGDYERAKPALEIALQMSQALKLPRVFSNALQDTANLYLSTGRVEEARYLFAAASDVAERHELSEAMARAQSNLGNLAMQWDLPDATTLAESALTLARRRGDRHSESIGAGNLMMLLFFAGRWEEGQRLISEMLRDNAVRAGAEYLHYPLAVIHTLRGEPEAARAGLEALTSWQDSDDPERRANHASVTVAVLLAEGQTDEALRVGGPALAHAIETLGASHESVRFTWPNCLDAAIHSERLEETSELIALLADRPPGHIPPYLSAQLARGQALAHALEGDDETVEAGLESVLAAFRALGYPYWLAVTQTDLAAWLIGRGRQAEAGTLLDEAIPVLERLGASAALARARSLVHPAGDSEPVAAG